MANKIKNLIAQAKETPFYKEVLMPELNRRLALYDDLMVATADPWERYGYVEAYKALKQFKIALEMASEEDDEEEQIKRTPTNSGPAKIKGGYYG